MKASRPRLAWQKRFTASIAHLKPMYGPFVGGCNVKGEGDSIPVENPATGEVISNVQSPTDSTILSAIQRADEAFRSGIWSRSSPAHRSQVLSNVARTLERRLPDLMVVESLQTGRCIREMRAQLTRVPEWLEYAASVVRTHQGLVVPTQGKLLNYVKRVPLGVVAQITPFNHPLLIAMKKIAPAIAAGNSIIVKPSELAPLTVLEFAEIATEAGLPPDVLTVLPGRGATVGKQIIQNELVKKIDITAGTDTGRAIGRIAGDKLVPFTAELGGKAPILVFDDADIRSAIAGVCFSAFIASGQTCVSGTRLLLHEGIYEQFISGLKERVLSITKRMGNPLNMESMMGPVISSAALKKVVDAVDNLPPSSRIIVGGRRMKGPSPLDGFDLTKGHFFAPTVVENVNVDDTLWTDELFGPVLAVTVFKTEDEAVRLANHSQYALGAGAWTTNLSRAHRLAHRLEAGIMWVNTWHRNDPSSPWGGMKNSGLGRENGVEAFESYTQSKSTIINIADPSESQTDDWFADGISSGTRYG